MTLFAERDQLITEVIKPILKRGGFKVVGNNFRKNEKDFIKVFNIQSSACNQDDNVSFYLNIGFLFPVLYELIDQQIPKVPKEYDCTFRIRTESLTGRNQSYRILPDTDLGYFQKLLINDLTDSVIPFFERYKEIEDCLKLRNEFDDQFASVDPYVGLTLIKNGRYNEGSEILDRYISTTHEGYAETLKHYREKLEIRRHHQNISDANHSKT